MKPKILFYDLEISPMLAWVYDMWDTNVLKVERREHLMSVSWRKYGDAKVSHLGQYDSKIRFDLDSTDDFDVARKVWELLDWADIVVAHNAKRFDNKVSNAMFIRHGFPPPSPYRTVDTLLVARQHFKFKSNKLDEIGDLLGVGRKTKVTHGALWHDCINGVEKAWDKMRIYNNQDVVLLEKIYYKLRPWMTNHPNMAILAQEEHVCPKCGGKSVQARGFRYTNASVFQRYKCNSCHGWFSERTKDKDGIKADYVSFA